MLNRDVFPLLALLLYPRRSGVDDDEVHRASDRSYSEKRRMSDRRRRRRRRQRGTRDITFARYRLIGITRFPIVSEKPDFALSLSLSLSLFLSLFLIPFVRGLSSRLTFVRKQADAEDAITEPAANSFGTAAAGTVFKLKSCISAIGTLANGSFPRRQFFNRRYRNNGAGCRYLIRIPPPLPSPPPPPELIYNVASISRPDWGTNIREAETIR